ncbi:hypothetical protein, partial [Vibrio paucivorans]
KYTRANHRTDNQRRQRAKPEFIIHESSEVNQPEGSKGGILNGIRERCCWKIDKIEAQLPLLDSSLLNDQIEMEFLFKKIA